LFEYLNEAVVPDIITLGKGLGGGVPLAAVLANSSAACFEPGDQGGTYNGNPLMTAVGLAVIDVIADDGFLHNVRERETTLRAGLEALGKIYDFVDVRGRGLLYAVSLRQSSAEAVRDEAFKIGLVINAARPNVLRFMPSLRVSDAEITSFLNLLDRALETSLRTQEGLSMQSADR